MPTPSSPPPFLPFAAGLLPGRRTGTVATAVALVAILFLTTASCAQPATEQAAGRLGSDQASPGITLATTVAPLTSITAAVIGDRAAIRGIVPEGTNSHTFEPPPSVARTLAEADIIFLNGLQLEEPTRRLADEHHQPGAEIVAVGEQVIGEDAWKFDFSFPRAEGKPNPHLWTSPVLVRRYAEIIRDTMTRRDPDGAAAYRRNTDAFLAKVDELDRAMRVAFATVPREDRKLLTYHDAYAYFAEHYDWTIIGAIQVADFEEPTAKEVGALIEQVRRERVKAIFGSEVFPSPVLEQIGHETGTRYVDTLRDDDLPGEPGAPQHSLLELLRYDYVTMTEALGGDAAALKSAPLAVAVPDRADYPQ